MLAALSPATLLLIPLALSGGALLWVVWAPASLRRKSDPEHEQVLKVLQETPVADGSTTDVATVLGNASQGATPLQDDLRVSDHVVYDEVVSGSTASEQLTDTAQTTPMDGYVELPGEERASEVLEDLSALGDPSLNTSIVVIDTNDTDSAVVDVLDAELVSADATGAGDLEDPENYSPDAEPSLLGLFAEDSLPDSSDKSWLGAVQRAVVEDGLAGLFDDVAQPTVRPSEEPQVAQVTKSTKPRLRRLRSDAGVSLAKFPFDPEVWDDPLSPRAMRRAQRKSALQEKRAHQENLRARKSLDKTRARLEELEKISVVETATQVATPDVAPFGDVWSRAANADAPEQSGIEQPRERSRARDEKKTEKKAKQARAKAAKESAKLAKLISAHALVEERRAREESEQAALVVPEELVSIIGVGGDATTEVEVAESSEVVSYGEEEAETGLLFEVIEGDLKDEPALSLELSDREVKRSEKKAEKESRRLEKLSQKSSPDKQARGTRKRSNESVDHALLFEGGLGADSVVADSGETGIAGDAARGWEQPDVTVDEPAMTASSWESAIDATDGLKEASVSSWEAAAAGVSTFIDPTGGARATNVGELVELGEAIEDTALRGPGRGREAILGTDEDAEALDLGMIVEVSNVPVRKKRRFGRSNEQEDFEEDTTPISEWVSEGTTLVTVTSDAVDHRQFDLPEPIPDRVIITFGGEE